MNYSLKTMDDYVADYLEAIDGGETPDPQLLIAERPDLREEFLRFVQLADGVARFAKLASRDGPSATKATEHADCTPLSNDALDAEQEWPTSSGIGQFDIIRSIGRGGMGIVYLARQRATNRLAALKVLRTSVRHDPKYRARLQREALACETLNHEHIVKVVDSGVGEEGNSFFAMELIDGIGLDQLITSQQKAAGRAAGKASGNQKFVTPVSATPATAVLEKFAPGDYYQSLAAKMADVADALHEAHEARIIHRDVKPSNILVDVDGKAWLTDFGLAAVSEELTAITASQDVLGTLAYMSPEQASGGNHRKLDRRTDIFSLGATLYYATTFSLPYEGSRPQILIALLQGRLESPCKRNAEIPRDLEAIIVRSMAVNPRDRYATAKELSSDLRSFASGRAVHTRLPGIVQRAFRWCEQNPIAAAATGASLLLAICTAFAVQVWNSRSVNNLNDRLSTANRNLVASNDALLTSRRKLQRELYVADMNSAYEAYVQQNVPSARQLLDRYRQASGNEYPGAVEQRGFAWQLLDKLTDSPTPRILCQHAAPATELALSLNGVFGLSAGHDGTVRRFNLAGEPDAKAFEIGGKLDALAITASGEEFLTGKNVPDGFNDVNRYRADSGELVGKCVGHWSSVEAIAISPDGNWIASADRYQDVMVYDFDGKLYDKWNTESRNETLAFVDDANILATFQADSNERYIKSWRFGSGQAASIVKTPWDAEYFSVSGSGTASSARRLVAATTEDVCLVAWPSNIVLAETIRIGGRVRCVDISSDGKVILIGCDQGTVFCWDLRQWLPNAELKLPSPRIIQASSDRVTDVQLIDVPPASQVSDASVIQFVTSSRDGLVQLWAMPKRTVSDWEAPAGLSEVRFWRPMQDPSDPGGVYLPFHNGQFARMDVSDLSTKVIIDIGQEIVGSGLLSVSRQRVYLPTSEGIAEVDTTEPSRVVRMLPILNKERRCKGIVQIGTQLLACFNDHVTVYDAETGEQKNAIPLPIDDALQILNHPDSTSAVVVCTEGILRIEEGRISLMDKPETAAKHLTWAEFSGDGRLIATAHHDRTIRVKWLDESQPTLSLSGHQAGVESLLFLDSDQILATGATNSSIRFWDLSTGRQLGELNGSQETRILLTTPSQSTFITGGVRGFLTSWTLQ